MTDKQRLDFLQERGGTVQPAPCPSVYTASGRQDWSCTIVGDSNGRGFQMLAPTLREAIDARMEMYEKYAPKEKAE